VVQATEFVVIIRARVGKRSSSDHRKCLFFQEPAREGLVDREENTGMGRACFYQDQDPLMFCVNARPVFY
jgi:hypothetical protein